MTFRENHSLDIALPSHKLVTRLSGKTDGLIASRDPLRNGTQTTNTRRPGSADLLKTLLCTQLAPARHVGQVGEKMRISLVRPSSRLNNDFSVEILFSEMTPLLLGDAPGTPAGPPHAATSNVIAAAAIAKTWRRTLNIPMVTPAPIGSPE